MVSICASACATAPNLVIDANKNKRARGGRPKVQVTKDVLLRANSLRPPPAFPNQQLNLNQSRNTYEQIKQMNSWSWLQRDFWCPPVPVISCYVFRPRSVHRPCFYFNCCCCSPWPHSICGTLPRKQTTGCTLTSRAPRRRSTPIAPRTGQSRSHLQLRPWHLKEGSS